MRKKDDTVSYTLEEINAMRRRGEDLTDWKRVEAMTEAELEASIAADPDDIHEELDWTKAFIGLPPPKKDIHIRIDSDVLDWFKKSGRGYQTKINNVLRAFVQTRRALTPGNPVRRKTTRSTMPQKLPAR
jgi:uncharacterized protein (DUF4415 family)